MDPATVTLAAYALKFSIEAAIALIEAGEKKDVKATIAALRLAESKTAQQYLDEAKVQPAIFQGLPLDVKLPGSP